MLRLMVMEDSQGVVFCEVDLGLRVTGRKAELLMAMVAELEGSWELAWALAALVATVLEVGWSWLMEEVVVAQAQRRRLERVVRVRVGLNVALLAVMGERSMGGPFGFVGTGTAWEGNGLCLCLSPWEVVRVGVVVCGCTGL